MNQKFLADISASTLQVVLNQLLGMAVFLLTSVYLPKEIYGELNWSVALLTFITGTLGLRLEQVVVRKAAAGEDLPRIMTLFMIHVLFTGTGFFILLLVLSFCFPLFFTAHSLIGWLAISQLLSYFTSPFKQLANGKERFDILATISSAANLVRVTGLIACIFIFHLNIRNVLIIFIMSSFAEFITGYLLVTRRMKIRFITNIGLRDYFVLLRESIPQIGSALLMAGITRMDWILLGLFSTTVLTAEYSFAYRVYELSPIPLLIIAPVLLSRLSRFFAGGDENMLLKKRKELGLLIRIEMILAGFLPLVMNLAWSPVFDSLTGHRYGTVNSWIFFILSCCIPFQYITNLAWSVHFAQQRLGLVFRITAITFSVILAGDLVFIPLFGGVGAAFVYLAAIITEYIFYLRSSRLSSLHETRTSLLVCMLTAAGAGFAAAYLVENTLARIGIATILFFLGLWATRQLRKSDLLYVYQLISRKKTETRSPPGIS